MACRHASRGRGGGGTQKRKREYLGGQRDGGASWAVTTSRPPWPKVSSCASHCSPALTVHGTPTVWAARAGQSAPSAAVLPPSTSLDQFQDERLDAEAGLSRRHWGHMFIKRRPTNDPDAEMRTASRQRWALCRSKSASGHPRDVLGSDPPSSLLCPIHRLKRSC